jgi:hypothetical protein
MAIQDYIDTAGPLYDDDWLATAAQASRVTREQVEDFVSALVASGPVRPAPGASR